MGLEEFQVTSDEISGSLFINALAAEMSKESLAKTVAINAVTVNTELVGSPGKSIDFPRRAGVAFAAITENASASAVTPSYTTVTVTPTKYGANVVITNEAVEDSRFDVIEEVLDTLTRASALQKDAVIIDALLDRLTDIATVAGSEDSTAFTLSVGNVIRVLEVTISGTTLAASTSYTVDHKLGVIHYATTIASAGLVTYEYAQSLTMLQSDTAGLLQGRDLLAAQAQIRANDYEPDVVLMHPAQHADLLNEARFYDVSQKGDAEVNKAGWVMRAFGMDIFVSTQIPDGNVVVVDSARGAKLVMKRALTVKFDDDITLDNRVVAATEMYACSVIRAEAVCLIGGMQDEDGRS